MSDPTPSSPPAAPSKQPYIGGQAVLEGVMMRSPSSFAVVVRRADGSLIVRERAVPTDAARWKKLPFVRGVASLVESLKLGSEALRFSAEQAERDAAAAEKNAKTLAQKGSAAGLSVLHAIAMLVMAWLTVEDAPVGKPPQDRRSGAATTLMLVLSVGFFVALPQGAAEGLNRSLSLGLAVQSPGFQLMTGILKLTIVITYLLLIRQMRDIRRVFQYHGAEHKTISTYEANERLTVANARAKTTLHPRCGTTFLVLVALVSIVVFTAIGGLLPRIHTGNNVLDQLVFFFEKLPFLPVIASITFELQRLSARYCTTGPLRVFLLPGFAVQRITTIEPDDDQLEVALASLHVTLFRERGETSARNDDVAFARYDELLEAESLRPALAAE